MDAMPHRFCSYKGVEIIEGHLIPNHARMLMSILSKMSVSSPMSHLKGKSPLVMLEKHGNRKFWSDSRCASAVGPREATIA